MHWGGREARYRGPQVTKFKDDDRLLGVALVQDKRGGEAILVSEISYIDDILYWELPIRDSEVIDLRAHGRRYKYWVTYTTYESYINLKGRKSHRCSLSELYRKRFEAAIQVGHVALLGDAKDPKIFYLMYQGGDKPALLLWDNTMVSAAFKGYVRDRALTPTYALFFDEERGKTNAFRAGDRSYRLVLTEKGHGRAWFLEEEYTGVPSEEALDELEKLDELLLELER